MKKLVGILFRLIARAVLLFPVLPVLYILNPVFKLRLGTIHTQRFGQLAINADIFLRRMNLEGKPKRTFYLFFGWDPANRQLLDMWVRMRGYPVRYLESRLGARIMFAWRPILKKTRFWEAAQDTATEYHLYNHTQPVLSFTEEEEAHGRAMLAEMGIGEDDWFVCVHARDGHYFREWRPEFEAFWAETDFRSIAIDNYVEAAQMIADHGGYAVRYGAFVADPFPITDNPRIIDYSTKFRDDFMDIYLVAKCRFFLGCCSGPLSLASAFNVPTISVNHHPYNFGYYQTNQAGHDFFVQRLLVDPADPGRIVPFWEAQQRGYFGEWELNSSLHETVDMYEMLETTGSDVADVCRDMLDALDGKALELETVQMQNFYADQYLSKDAEYQDSALLAPRFALKYRDLIVPPETKTET